ncbi:MAG TPA: Na+-transporting methylmalonyl-CoA/oxaloacetate decarboxylase subunit beta [Clostridiales bacterium]|nr:Na+-transporting methylmalonyl-CoA/oxaloacetate decarboxylase subunit beta [Clostridiales bacterium]
MKVHYTASLWSKEKGACGSIQKTNWQFEFLGLGRCIPCIYHFREGIVFDLLTFLDTNKMRGYFEKYAEIADKLTPIEQQCAEQEHPYQEMKISEIWIDGHKIEGYSSSAATNIPFARESSELLPVQKAYGSMLDEAACFNCHRFCVPYPKADTAMQKLLRILHSGRISTLKLVTGERRRFYPVDLRFTLSEEEGTKNVSFIHPITGITHHLYLQHDEVLEIPQAADRKQCFYFMVASYEIDPPLQPDDRLQFDNSISYATPPTEDFAPTASSVGIIGRAFGPTAIFLPGRDGKKVSVGSHGLPLHYCFSTMTLEKSQRAQFVIQGLDAKIGDRVIYEFER